MVAGNALSIASNAQRRMHRRHSDHFLDQIA